MAGFGHGPATPAETEDPAISRRNARNGLGLFAIYFALYAGFVGLNAFRAETMTAEFSGINLAVWYGLGLIVAAFALAMVYMVLCRPCAASTEEAGR